MRKARHGIDLTLVKPMMPLEKESIDAFVSSLFPGLELYFKI